MDYKEKVIALLNSQELSKERKEKLESIFPELKESEDERIRKALIKAVISIKKGESPWFVSDKETCDKVLAWLEKQGKHNIGISEVTEQELQDNLNKAELRFKKGEWIIFNEHHNSVYQVEKIDSCRYYLRHYLGGTFSVHFDNVLIRRWTIEDAWDGDILYSPGNNLLWLHKDTEKCHCCINLNYNSNNISFGSDIVIPSDVCPATKEQRNTFMKAMSDAGYTFDFNKKQLNKIEENPVWSEEDRDYFDAIIAKLEVTQGDALLTDNQMEFLKSLKNRVKSQPKQEWSEEDSYNMDWIVEALIGLDGDKRYCDTCKRMAKWLKSLENRYAWKPTDEQMYILNWVANILLHHDGIVEEAASKKLQSLYNDLKKIKE